MKVLGSLILSFIFFVVLLARRLHCSVVLSVFRGVSKKINVSKKDGTFFFIQTLFLLFLFLVFFAPFSSKKPSFSLFLFEMKNVLLVLVLFFFFSFVFGDTDDTDANCGSKCRSDQDCLDNPFNYCTFCNGSGVCSPMCGVGCRHESDCNTGFRFFFFLFLFFLDL